MRQAERPDIPREERNAMILKDYERMTEYLNKKAAQNTREIAVKTLAVAYKLDPATINKVIRSSK